MKIDTIEEISRFIKENVDEEYIESLLDGSSNVITFDLYKLKDFVGILIESDFWEDDPETLDVEIIKENVYIDLQNKFMHFVDYEILINEVRKLI